MKRALVVFAIALGILVGAFGPPRVLSAELDRNFAGSAQLDWHLVPRTNQSSSQSAASQIAVEGFTTEASLKLAVDVTDRLWANVKVCFGCHGFEMPMMHLDYRIANELEIRVGRFSPQFGAFNLRHDPRTIA